jgi:uncharacterized protein (TIGR02246 family)
MSADVSSITTDNDREMVQRLYRQLLEGWNCGDGAAFAAPFAEECEFSAFDGSHFTTRQALAEFHQVLFDKWMTGTRLVGRVERVHFLGPDVAVIYAIGGTILRNKTAVSPERDSLQTLVAQRQDGVWRLVTFQNTRLRPIGISGVSFLIWALSDWFWRLFRLNPTVSYE